MFVIRSLNLNVTCHRFLHRSIDRLAMSETKLGKDNKGEDEFEKIETLVEQVLDVEEELEKLENQLEEQVDEILQTSDPAKGKELIKSLRAKEKEEQTLTEKFTQKKKELVILRQALRKKLIGFQEMVWKRQESKDKDIQKRLRQYLGMTTSRRFTIKQKSRSNLTRNTDHDVTLEGYFNNLSYGTV